MFRKAILIATLLFSMSAYARHSATTLIDPPPLPVPQGVSAVDVEKAIIVSGVGRHWSVVDHKPGLVVLQYSPREFWVKVNVAYDAHTVNISYLDSDNLEYGQEDGHAVIHPNYNRWINNLAHDIDSAMAIAIAK